MSSTFDVAVSGLLDPSASQHSPDTLAEMCRILKPDGKLYLGQVVTGGSSDEVKMKSSDATVSALKLSGFVNVSQVRNKLKFKHRCSVV